MFESRPLIEYLPEVLGGVREYQALTAAADPELAGLWAKIQDALDDQFVLTATENGVRRREKILRIVPKATWTLEERKFTILTRMAEQLPFTLRKLKLMLDELCGPEGYRLTLSAGSYALDVKVALTAKNSAGDVDTMLRRVCPANLVISVSLLYNTWRVIGGFTWGYLGTKTWRQIKEEVL